MDAVYQINVAKTEFREAYNTGDVARLLAFFDDAAVDMSESFPSGFGARGKAGLAERVAALFAEYSVQLVPIVMDIVPCGDRMFDYGWHEFTLTPKAGGAPVRVRQRYMELWAKNPSGDWKILFYMNNQDVRNEFNGQRNTWFLSEAAANSNS